MTSLEKSGLNYQFIINPEAGNKRNKQVIQKIRSVFAKSNSFCEFHITQKTREATLVAAEAVQNGADIVVAVGGDGTLNEVVNGLVGTKGILGVIPTGTGNDFANSIQMPHVVEKAAQRLLRRNTKEIDLGRVKGRYFINLAGVGFDGAVAQRTNQYSKKIRGNCMYLVSVLRTLLTFRPVPMKISLDDREFFCSPMLVAVGIGSTFGGGIKVVPRAVQDDGLFDVCIIDSLNKGTALYYLTKALQGKHGDMAHTHMYRARNVKIEIEKPLLYQVEGEVFTACEMEFTLLPRAIEVITG